MTRTRLILLIRCVTLLGVGALLLDAGWLFAGASLVLVGLMMPVFAAANACCSGGTQHTQVQVVLASIANGTCGSCTTFNGTYTLSLGISLDPCTYTISPFPGAFVCDAQNLFFVWAGAASSATQNLVQLSGLGKINNWGTATSSPPQDCSISPGTLPEGTSGFPWSDCDFTSSTADVTVL